MAQVNRKPYDVALSFAGEDRPYVSQVAEYVRKRGLNVFYDSFFEVELWGKDLTETLDTVYRKDAQFVVIFISSSYVKKEWTNFERRSALAAAIRSSSEYVLPVRFDDTDLPGLPPTVAYKDARKLSADALAEMIIAKLGVSGKTHQRDGIIAWRFANNSFVNDLSGEGARRFGGRWNETGVSIIYCSSSYCAAFMELMVHMHTMRLVRGKVAMQLLIPPEVSIRTIYEDSLPKEWRDTDNTRAVGSEWVRSMESCILSAPSAIVPFERILLLNPGHPEFNHIRFGPSEPIHIDPRLF